MLDKSINRSNLIKLAIKSFLIAFCGFLFPFIYIFFPTMYVTESIKQGIIKIMTCFTLVCGIIAFAFGPVVGLVLFTIFGPFILAFHYMIVTKRDVYLTIALCTLIFFASMIFVLYSLGITGDVLNAEATKQLLVNHVKHLMESNQMGTVTVPLQSEDILVLYNRFIQILPATLVLISIIVSYVTFVLTGRSLFASGRLIPQPSSFEFFQIPQEFILWGMVSLLFLNFFGENVLGGLSSVIYSNLLAILLFLLFLQGMSVLKYSMTRLGMGPIMQFICMLFSFVFSFTQMILTFIGLFDSFINIRKI